MGRNRGLVGMGQRPGVGRGLPPISSAALPHPPQAVPIGLVSIADRVAIMSAPTSMAGLSSLALLAVHLSSKMRQAPLKTANNPYNPTRYDTHEA